MALQTDAVAVIIGDNIRAVQIGVILHLIMDEPCQKRIQAGCVCGCGISKLHSSDLPLSFVFPAELPHLLVEFIVDMLAEPFFAAGLHRALGRKPLHAAVLVGLDREHVRVVRDEKIRDVQMQVRGDVLPALHVAVYSQHLKRENVLACRTDVFDAALLADFPERDGEQVLFPVGVPAEPRPRIVDVVIRHQHAVEALVHHPG